MMTAKLRSRFWTDQRQADLRRLWAEGLRRVDIADYFRVTEGAVIGALKRYDVPMRTGCKRRPNDATLRPKAVVAVPPAKPKPPAPPPSSVPWPSKQRLMAGR